MSDAIAVGVPVFSRTAALRQFLESVPEYVTTAYVADNGHTEDREDLYARAWPFDLEVLDLGFDVGIGACRHAIAEAATESYLFVGDCDMRFTDPADLRRLREELAAHPDLGGLSGWLIEGGTVRAGARNLVERRGRLFKSVAEPPELEGERLPFARFDFIPQAGLFKTEVFDDYCYDPDIYNSEHVDFFYGHHDAGAWEFGSTPAVLVEHNRWIDPDYRESRRGNNHVDEALLAEKWGFETIEPGTNVDWAGYRDRSVLERAFDVFREVSPPSVWIPIKRVSKRVIE
jgi:hypothetical protein